MLTLMGGQGLYMLDDRENSSSGNQMTKISKNSIIPPRPYFVRGLLGLPRGVGKVWRKNTFI